MPIVITSLGARTELNDAVHGWGGITLHDIIDDRFARKAVDKGADGLIAVAAGAGGHAGRWSPFALIQEIRRWFDGPLILSGAIATGGAVLAAQAMGADLAYIGSPFIATPEARASEEYKQGIVEGGAADIVNSALFTGDPRQLPARIDRCRRARPGQIAAAGAGRDELPVGDWRQGVAGHLGIGPGHRRHRRRRSRRRAGRPYRPRICRGEGEDLRLGRAFNFARQRAGNGVGFGFLGRHRRG